MYFSSSRILATKKLQLKRLGLEPIVTFDIPRYVYFFG